MSKHRNYLVAGSVISGILVLLTGVVTVSSIRRANVRRDEMRRTFDSLQSYFRRNPFPNEQNLKAEQANLETLRGWNRALVDALASHAIVIEGEHTPGSFTKTCEDTVNALRRRAPKGEGDQSVIVPNFNFGFDRYDITQNGLPAAHRDVPRLLRQLQMVDRLVQVLYNSDLIRLEQVFREEFDLEAAATAARTVRGRAGRTGTAAAGGSVITMSRVEAEPLVDKPFEIDRQRFGFVFVIREEGLFKLIEQIHSMWPFAMIASLDFEKTAGDVVFVQPQRTDAPAAAGGLSSGIVPPPPGQTSRIVSGALREAPIRVALTIDVYTLSTEDETEASD